jgi:L-lactate utilization protein LutC
MQREEMFQRIRTALAPSVPEPRGVRPESIPPPRIRVPEVDVEARIASLFARVEALAGATRRAATPAEARDFVAAAVAGKSAVVSNAPYLAECGIAGLPGVETGFLDKDTLRLACAAADIGITSADFALADTGTLVLLASPREARMVSLLPPAHIAVLPKECILTGLDELFARVPEPASLTSSMVLITGPSRTADIEQILVRGVHGPGRITVVVVG